MIINSIDSSKPSYKTVNVDANELQDDGVIIIREMSIAQAIEFNSYIESAGLLKKETDNSLKFIEFQAALISATMVNEDGKELISINNCRWIIDNWPYGLLNRLFQASAYLNGFSGDKVEDEKKPSTEAQSEHASEE
ncbi:hypothetical protein [Dickeya phage Sucellus]|nr:hypothetical protein [Dickeya phage Sucellus]